MRTDPWHDLSREAELDIYRFAVRRLETGKELSPRHVEVQMRHLRWLLRQSMSLGGPANLVELTQDPDLCARIFREPGKVSRGQVSLILQAFEDFLHLMVDGDAAEGRLEAIEALLIPRQINGWYQKERVGGGHSTREEGVRLLFAEDLLALTEKAKEGKSGERVQRDLCLVALYCWSSLRVEEIVTLCWEHLSWEDDRPDATFGAWVRCSRGDTELTLPIHRRAAQPLAVLYALTKRIMDRQPTGRVFRALRSPYEPLSYRSVKEIYDEALTKTGLQANRRDLLAAYAHHLMTLQGYSIVDLAKILGYNDPHSVRQLLKTHLAWQLNRKVDEGGKLFEHAIG
jgi:integrase